MRHAPSSANGGSTHSTGTCMERSFVCKAKSRLHHCQEPQARIVASIRIYSSIVEDGFGPNVGSGEVLPQSRASRQESRIRLRPQSVFISALSVCSCSTEGRRGTKPPSVRESQRPAIGQHRVTANLSPQRRAPRQWRRCRATLPLSTLLLRGSVRDCAPANRREAVSGLTVSLDSPAESELQFSYQNCQLPIFAR